MSAPSPACAHRQQQQVISATGLYTHTHTPATTGKWNTHTFMFGFFFKLD